MSPEEPTQKKKKVEHVGGLAARILGPLREEQIALFPKFTREQVDQLFATAKQEQRAEARYKMLVAIFTFVLGIFVLASICLMCWLFLYFKQPQFIEKVIIGFLSGIAGIGSGFSLSLFFRPPGKKE